jgi:copper resistance protein C
MPRLLASAAAAFALALGAAAVFVSGASAHARYSDSTPGRGEVLETSPGRVEVTFTQEIQRIQDAYGIDVESEDGTSVTDGETVFPDDLDRATIAIDVQPDLDPGRYVVSYWNVSDVDGHAGEGAFAFYVGVEPTEEQLALDADLDEVYEEDDDTPVAPVETPDVTPPDGNDTPAPVATPDTDDNDDEDDGPGQGTLIAVLVFLAVSGAIAGGYYWLRRRG